MFPVPRYLTPDGVEMVGGVGITISDLRNQFPDCDLIEANYPAVVHDIGSFALVPGVLYQVTLPFEPQTEGTSN